MASLRRQVQGSARPERLVHEDEYSMSMTSWCPYDDDRYCDIDWSEFSYKDLDDCAAAAWAKLGWTEELWDNGGDLPSCWKHLSQDEERAAEALCYDETSWNEEYCEEETDDEEPDSLPEDEETEEENEGEPDEDIYPNARNATLAPSAVTPEQQSSPSPSIAPSAAVIDEAKNIGTDIPSVAPPMPEPLPSSPEPTDKQSSLSPSAAPSAAGIVPENAINVATAPPTAAPIPVVTPSPTVDATPSLPEEKNHDETLPPKIHDEEPHAITSGASGSSRWNDCNHAGGIVQNFTCKAELGFEYHPVTFSVVFVFLLVVGCCTCRRACKSARREDNHGEYLAVANQYDDVLFSDTFDDNYSEFADDHDSDGSIEDEDDWTKGPNIELSGIRKEKDDLTLEEMNG